MGSFRKTTTETGELSAMGTFDFDFQNIYGFNL
jgi:hypothetical protein